MGLFDGSFSLPTVQSLTSVSSDLSTGLTNALGFNVSSAGTKLAESVNAQVSQFGTAAPQAFTKLASTAPSWAQTVNTLTTTGTSGTGADAAVSAVQTVTITGTKTSQSASNIRHVTGATGEPSAHKVTLTQSDDPNEQVVFEVMPEVTEAHTVEYEAVAPAQFPGAFQKYKGTSATQWTINATFISRTSEEASKNYDNLALLRSWTMPYFGGRTDVSWTTRAGGKRTNASKLGAPPDVLRLSGLRQLIGEVPVVITSLNWNWPKDVDYIATTYINDEDNALIPWPAVLNVAIQCVESFSIEEIDDFDLLAYRNGDLYLAYNGDYGDLTAAEPAKTAPAATSTESVAPAVESQYNQQGVAFVTLQNGREANINLQTLDITVSK